MKTGKLFFSYARADSKFVLKLAENLRSIDTNLWLDQLDIPAGARWDRAVQEALHAAPCLLVVLSPASVASDNVMDEVSFGIENGKTIVPILYKNCDIPFRLKRLQYIDFRDGYDDGFKRLVQEIKAVDQLPTAPSVKLSSSNTEQAKRRQPQGNRYLYIGGFVVAIVIAATVLLTKEPRKEPAPPPPPPPAPASAMNASDYLRRGDALYNKGDFDGAIKEYSEAIRLKPDYMEAYSGRSLALQGKGDFDGAMKDSDETARLADSLMKQLRKK